MIKIENLCKRFGDKVVLDNLSLEFERGKTTVVLGRSGTGKSVLLKLILRLMDIDSGRIYVDNIDTTDFSELQMMAVRKKMGMLFQGSALFDSMSVFENVAYMLREHTSLSESEIKERVEEKLRFVEMLGTQDLMPSELSGGMQKRIALARAMANNPDYIFFDEPTTGLDPITAQTINELIKRVQVQTHTTVIVVTHDLDSANFVGQKFVLLKDGGISFEGTPSEFNNSNIEFVKLFRTGGKVING
ncbi:MAG: ATP-binding cassette domain-containing protein [candidate division Zixibacteria bacterium]|jgi:phospholipid/cholesterol/gamma-HCH transport system ATP-binding protein|nr:ATP-binding cassette domain-containing protein [candidate division Zixibacteria bacterium]